MAYRVDPGAEHSLARAEGHEVGAGVSGAVFVAARRVGGWWREHVGSET